MFKIALSPSIANCSMNNRTTDRRMVEVGIHEIRNGCFIEKKYQYSNKKKQVYDKTKNRTERIL